ncbi:MAG: hypothetical protein AAFR67_05610 [Chloroflexota bacterium]
MNEIIKNMTTMKGFTEAMHNLSGAIMLIGQTLISAFFVIIILVLVLIVEIQRVAHGIEIFESSPALAYGGAFVLVLMLLTLEFVTHYMESKYGYESERRTDFSLRIWLRNFKYWLGLGKKWEQRHKSPAHSIKVYSRLLTVTILVLALAGSMRDAISEVEGNWVEGIQSIAVESTLAEIVEWSGGLLFALALVVGAQRLTAYIAQRASETNALAVSLDESSETQLADDYHQDIEPETPQATLSPDFLSEFEYEIASEEDTKPVYPAWLNETPLKPDYEPLPVNVPDEAEENGVVTEVVTLGYTETCDICGWTTDPKSTPANAKRALAMHKRHHHSEV